jgi:hypothetical protein
MEQGLLHRFSFLEPRLDHGKKDRRDCRDIKSTDPGVEPEEDGSSISDADGDRCIEEVDGRRR